MKKVLLAIVTVTLFGAGLEAAPKPRHLRSTAEEIEYLESVAVRFAAGRRLIWREARPAIPAMEGRPAIPAFPAGFFGEVIAASCERADFLDAVSAGGSVNTSNGDTLIIPSGDCHWSNAFPVTFTKALVIRGDEACTLAANDHGVLVPSSCPTNFIRDSGSSLFTWTFPSGSTYPFANSLSEIQFSPGLNDGASSPFVNITCNTYGINSLRVYHTMNNGWDGQTYSFNNCAGVVDHNYIDGGEQSNFYFRAQQFYGPNNEVPASAGFPDYGDASWNQPVELGMPSATQVMNHTYPSVLYVEYNTIKGGSRACWDGTSGARIVGRYNLVYKCTPASHGTDSTSRERAIRYAEYYRNHYLEDGGSRAYQWEVRDGSGLAFQNTSDRSGTQTSALLKNYRAAQNFPPWGPQDGYNLLDLNDPMNPYEAGTSTGGSASTMVDMGASFSDYSGGYILRKLTITDGKGGFTTCSNILAPARACFAPIVSNTSTTITFYTTGDETAWVAGEDYEVTKVLRAIDQPGVGGGSKLASNFSCTGFTMSAGVVTGTCTGHGLVATDWVIPNIQSNPTTCPGFAAYSPRDFAYPAIVSTAGTPLATNFTFPYPPGIDSSVTCNATGGNISEIPKAVWNDQEDFPVLTWLNTKASGINAPIEPSTGTSHVLGETYADYDPTFTGDKGTIGAGSRASRPTECEVGSYWWATNGGGNWNLVGDDGALDKCIAPDTWDDDWYIPYTNPHPLSISGLAISSITPASGAQNTVVMVDIVGTGFTGGNADVTVSDEGITVFGFDVISDVLITASLGIETDAPVGEYNIFVETDAGLSNGIPFDVTCTSAFVGFTSQPSSAALGFSLGVVQVTVACGDGTPNTASTATIVLAEHGSSTWGTLTSGSSLSKAAVAGVATWTDLSVTGTAGSGSITAASTGLTGATSDSINITVSTGGPPAGRARARINAK